VVKQQIKEWEKYEVDSSLESESSESSSSIQISEERKSIESESEKLDSIPEL
jgi:hypothetical protein